MYIVEGKKDANVISSCIIGSMIFYLNKYGFNPLCINQTSFELLSLFLRGRGTLEALKGNK